MIPLTDKEKKINLMKCKNFAISVRTNLVIMMMMMMMMMMTIKNINK